MKPYTVVLLRPEYLCEHTGEEYGLDAYVARVSAENYMKALNAAQAEVMEADKKDKLKPLKPEDYKMCVIFNGHHTPVAHGWQV